MVMLDRTWCPWIDGRVPNGFWDLRENRVRYLDWLGGQCGFLQPEDWYQITKPLFKNNHGGGLLCTQYEDSVYAALRDYAPDFTWLPWKFRVAPKRLWEDAGNRFCYMQWLEQHLGFEEPEDWYGVTKKTFTAHGGGRLLNAWFDDSVIAAVREYMPDYPWKPWLFVNTPQRYWHQADNRRTYMTWLGEQLGYSSPEGWYHVTKETFYENCGAGLLRSQYNDSPQLAVHEFLPEFDWKPWLFVSVPQRYWQQVDHRLGYLRWLGQQLGYSRSTDWFRLSTTDFKDHHGAGLLGYYSSGAVGQALAEALRRSKTTQHTLVWPLIQLIECSVTDKDPAALLLAIA